MTSQWVGEVSRGTILLVSDETLTRMDLVGSCDEHSSRSAARKGPRHRGPHATRGHRHRHQRRVDAGGTKALPRCVATDQTASCADCSHVRVPPALAELAADLVVTKPITQAEFLVDVIPLLGTGS